MCKCDPRMRTPYCGNGSCQWPEPDDKIDCEINTIVTTDDVYKKYYKLLESYTDVCRKLGTLIGTIEVMLIMNKIENEDRIRKVLEECRYI